MSPGVASRRPPREWTDVKGARLIVLIALVKGLMLVWLVPPFQAPDEYGHYDYAVYLSKVPPADFVLGRFDRPVTLVQQAIVTREVEAVAAATGAARHLTNAEVPDRLPVRDMLARASSWSEAEERDLPRVTTWSGLMNYPPLYYAMAGSLLATQRAVGVNPVARYYSVRLFSLALFLLALVAAASALARLEAGALWKTTTLALIALQPQLSLLSVSVQPDMLGLLLVTAALAVLVDTAARAPLAHAATFGALVGAVALTKSHYAPPLAAAALVVLAWALATGRVSRAAAARWAVVATAVSLAVGGWWYLRSALLFDNWIGLTAWLPGPADATWTSNLDTWWRLSVPMTFRSYWGVWGWFDYGVDGWMVGPLLAISLLPAMLIGVALAAWARERRARPQPATGALGPWLVPVTAALVFVVEMIAIGAAMGMVQAQGRHWLAFVLPQAMYLAAPVALTGRAGTLLIAWARPRLRLLLAAGVALLVLALVGASASLARVPSGWVELDVQATGDGLATVFADTGHGFNVAEHASLPVRTRDGVARLAFPMWGPVVRRLRVDFTSPGASVSVGNAAVLAARGTRTRIPLGGAAPTQGVAELEAVAGRFSFSAVGTPTAIVELALDTPVALGSQWTQRLQRPPWEFWSRVWRRVPALTAVTWLWPTLLAASLLSLALWNAARRGPIPRDTLWPAALAAGLTGLCIALTLWLALETWLFYD